MEQPRANEANGGNAMKRALLGITAVLGLVLGSAMPVAASLETDIAINCDDGDSIPLTVDLDTLSALTDSVAAINAADAGFTCSIAQLSAPLPVVTFGSVAAAATSGGYVIGAGTVHVGCPNNTSQLFTGSFAVKMYQRSGSLRGSASLKVASGQCVAGGTLSSTPTCLVISPTTLGGGRAWANSFVTATTGSFFAPQIGKTIGWGFEDNGPNGGTLMKDKWRVIERPGSCPTPGDPNDLDFYTLVTGDLTVRP